MNNLEVLSQKELETTFGVSEATYQGGVEFGKALKGAADRMGVIILVLAFISSL